MGEVEPDIDEHECGGEARRFEEGMKPYYLVQVYGREEASPTEWRAKTKKELVGVLKLVIDNYTFLWFEVSRIEKDMDRKLQPKPAGKG